MKTRSGTEWRKIPPGLCQRLLEVLLDKTYTGGEFIKLEVVGGEELTAEQFSRLSAV